MSQSSMFSSEEPPARVSASPEKEAAWTIRVLSWRGDFLTLLQSIARAGFFGRTCPASYQAGAMRRQQIQEIPANDGGKPQTLTPFLPRFANAGIVAPGRCWTLNTVEWRNGAGVCSLSDILETGKLPQRFFLTPKACRGILRRAARRGKELPETLRIALEAVAQEPNELATREGKTT